MEQLAGICEIGTYQALQELCWFFVCLSVGYFIIGLIIGKSFK